LTENAGGKNDAPSIKIPGSENARHENAEHGNT